METIRLTGWLAQQAKPLTVVARVVCKSSDFAFQNSAILSFLPIKKNQHPRVFKYFLYIYILFAGRGQQKSTGVSRGRQGWAGHNQSSALNAACSFNSIVVVRV